MRRAPILAPLLGLVLVLAGCTEGRAPRDQAGVSGPPDGLGTLAGLVADEEQRPIDGARVELINLSRTADTTHDGRFQFVRVPTGPVDVRVTHPLHEGRLVRANVAAADVSAVTVLLTRLPTKEAYFDVFPFAGLQQCMIYTNVFLGSCSHAYTAAYGTFHRNGVNLSQYGAPAEPVSNKYRYNFSVRPEHTGIVSELKWTAGSDAARYYVLQLSCAYYDPVIDDCVAPGQTTFQPENTYARARGVSPLRIEWTHEKPLWLPWVMSRAYLSGPVDRPAGVALEQRVDMTNSVFYDGPVPKDWSYLAPAGP